MRRILNNAVSLMVVVIVLFLVIPLPTYMLDVLIVINIALSIMILMITMNISEALEFSIFPSLLLVTTLFRLGLNVSSTRLILSNGGNAGVVIKSFGSLITQGNIVIGILIFLIIVLVQFIVITKGAERVSEVAARFTLDAMPGKQMAIDADLSSGLITESDARMRRYKIQKEADFYGAMDGATKIVKGDAIMSLIITVINFVAGLIIGMVQGGGDINTVWASVWMNMKKCDQVLPFLIWCRSKHFWRDTELMDPWRRNRWLRRLPMNCRRKCIWKRNSIMFWPKGSLLFGKMNSWCFPFTMKRN